MKRRVLITGATSGIGLALAQRLGRHSGLLLTGRRTKEDAGPLPPGAAYVMADQREPQDATETIVGAISDLGWDGLDLAILNAGVGVAADPAGETSQSIRATIDTNAVAAMMQAHALYPLLRGARGRLVLIGSVAHRGAPGFASYAASKAALHGFGRALIEEWRGSVMVQVIHPGPTASGMHAKAGHDAGAAERFFLPVAATARMIEAVISDGRPVATASYMRFLLGGYWLGGGA